MNPLRRAQLQYDDEVPDWEDEATYTPRKLMIKDIIGYEISADYNLLWDLAEKQSIICLSSTGGVGQTIEDDGYREIRFSYNTVFAWKKDDFNKQCRRLNVEFIIPTRENL